MRSSTKLHCALALLSFADHMSLSLSSVVHHYVAAGVCYELETNAFTAAGGRFPFKSSPSGIARKVV